MKCGSRATCRYHPAGTAFLNSTQRDSHNECVEDKLGQKISHSKAVMKEMGHGADERSANYKKMYLGKAAVKTALADLEGQHRARHKSTAKLGEQHATALGKVRETL